jgi:hypothetical protein
LARQPVDGAPHRVVGALQLGGERTPAGRGRGLQGEPIGVCLELSFELRHALFGGSCPRARSLELLVSYFSRHRAIASELRIGSPARRAASAPRRRPHGR